MSDEAKTFTQEEVNAIVRDRITRERAKMADYDELKAEASKAKALQADIDKLNDTVTELTEAGARTAREQLISTIARTHGIADADDVALFLTGTDEATLTKQAERLAARGEAKEAADTKRALVVKSEGTPTKGTDDANSGGLRELSAALFNKSE